MRLASWCRLEILAPALLAVTFAADLGLRFAPLDWFSFRAWEALRVRGAAGPFRPNRHYVNDAAYGDLANLGNVPALREYHAERVTTDSLGYRNAPGLAASGQVRVLLTGTSFSAGTEVGDTETLAAQLTDLTGTGVYNAALADWDFATLRGLARRTGMGRGVLVFEYLEGREPPSLLLEGRPPVGRCSEALASQAALCGAYNWLDDRTRVSPVRVVTRRLLRRVQNDRWLPNPDRDVVHRARLPDGREMLFEAAELEWTLPRADEQRIVRYFTWLQRRMSREGIALLVVLAPRKHTVYGPLVQDPVAASDSGAQSLARIATGLTTAGVPVVDLTPVLRAAAADALAQGRYLYFLDDTHWNAAGIEAAARAIAPELRRRLP